MKEKRSALAMLTYVRHLGSKTQAQASERLAFADSTGTQKSRMRKNSSLFLCLMLSIKKLVF